MGEAKRGCDRDTDVASAKLSADPLCMFVGSHVSVCLLASALFVSCFNKTEYIHCFTATVLLDTAV